MQASKKKKARPLTSSATGSTCTSPSLALRKVLASTRKVKRQNALICNLQPTTKMLSPLQLSEAEQQIPTWLSNLHTSSPPITGPESGGTVSRTWDALVAPTTTRPESPSLLSQAKEQIYKPPQASCAIEGSAEWWRSVLLSSSDTTEECTPWITKYAELNESLGDPYKCVSCGAILGWAKPDQFKKNTLICTDCAWVEARLRQVNGGTDTAVKKSSYWTTSMAANSSNYRGCFTSSMDIICNCQRKGASPTPVTKRYT